MLDATGRSSGQLRRRALGAGSGLLGLAIVAVGLGSIPDPPDAPPPAPVLVELFTSEGCASCPPADELLIALDEEQGISGAVVIPLGQHVAYWNAAWHDRFSSSVFTERQRAYHPRTSALYTPEMVVDGHLQFVGGQRKLAEHAIAMAARDRKTPLELSVSPGDGRSGLRVTVRAPEAATLVLDDEIDLWLAVTETGLETLVERGENARRVLRHAAVVRRLTRIATHAPPVPTRLAEAVPVAVDRTWRRDRLRLVAFLQERESRRVRGIAHTTMDDVEASRVATARARGRATATGPFPAPAPAPHRHP